MMNMLESVKPRRYTCSTRGPSPSHRLAEASINNAQTKRTGPARSYTFQPAGRNLNRNKGKIKSVFMATGQAFMSMDVKLPEL